MSLIRGKGNKNTEIALLQLMRTHGIVGWRRNVKAFGRPDFVFRRYKLAIFVDGCFWHGCPKHSNLPANNGEFWAKKLTANKARDRLVTRTLRAKGWKVLRIWEHELTHRHAALVARRIHKMLSS